MNILPWIFSLILCFILLVFLIATRLRIANLELRLHGQKIGLIKNEKERKILANSLREKGLECEALKKKLKREKK